MRIEARLEKLGRKLPSPPTPVANYEPAVRAGDLLMTSGILPMKDGELLYKGKLGEGVSIEQGREAARLALLNALAVVKRELGDLDKILRVVKLNGYVASAPGFIQQPAVLNGASDLAVEIFKDAGRHARVAVGASELPLGSPVEIELIIQVKP